jgi:hypothetical protein
MQTAHIRGELERIGQQIHQGDDSELWIWILPGRLAVRNVPFVITLPTEVGTPFRARPGLSWLPGLIASSVRHFAQSSRSWRLRNLTGTTSAGA